jgi:hypothetical protein
MFVVKIFRLDCSSYKINDVEIKLFNSLEESKKFVVEKHYEIDYDNVNTDLTLDEYLEKYSLEDIEDKLYDTFEYEIIEEEVN